MRSFLSDEDTTCTVASIVMAHQSFGWSSRGLFLKPDFVYASTIGNQVWEICRLANGDDVGWWVSQSNSRLDQTCNSLECFQKMGGCSGRVDILVFPFRQFQQIISNCFQIWYCWWRPAGCTTTNVGRIFQLLRNFLMQIGCRTAALRKLVRDSVKS